MNDLPAATSVSFRVSRGRNPLPAVLAILCGESGSGKTTLCLRAIDEALKRHLSAAGLVTVPRIVAGQKVKMDVRDVRTGEERLLGQFVDDTGDPVIEHWQFSDDGIAWGEQMLRRATPCDVLVIDELGPLELIYGKGWYAAVDLLLEQRYRMALVAVRPLLLPTLRNHLESTNPLTLSVSKENNDSLLAHIEHLIEVIHDSC